VNNLPEKHVAELCDLLMKKTSDQAELNATEWNSVKNEALDKLIDQKKLPDGLGKLIVDMYRSRATEEIWRDYCVQHMTLYCQRKWPGSPAPPDDAEAGMIRSALWEAADETGGTIAGTALLGLERLSRTDPSLDRKRVGAKALSYASSPATPSKTRTTALQVCAEMGLKEILPAARSIAGESGEAGLRISAIAAMGALGEAGDRAMLEEIGKSSPDPLVQRAASAAIARLKTAGR
jgi:hypothetical protein